jgi:hypothetical protein
MECEDNLGNKYIAINFYNKQYIADKTVPVIYYNPHLAYPYNTDKCIVIKKYNLEKSIPEKIYS